MNHHPGISQSIDLVQLAPLPESDDESPVKEVPSSKVTENLAAENGDTEMKDVNDGNAPIAKADNDAKGKGNEDEDDDEEGDEDDEEV